MRAFFLSLLVPASLMLGCSGASGAAEGDPSSPSVPASEAPPAAATEDAGARADHATPAPDAASPEAGDHDAGPGARHTLYVHGRDESGTPAAWAYWRGAPGPGVNPIAVNWNGTLPIADTNVIVRAALDTYCKGNDACYVACHSSGCAQVGYALAMYGTTKGAHTWNILFIAAAGSVEGGSELADLRKWSTNLPLDADLTTRAMRKLYDHDANGGVSSFMFAGAGWSDSHPLSSFAGFLPGDDDLGVAYHSACGVANVAFAKEDNYCNESSIICPGARITTSKHPTLWANHTIEFLDGNSDYSHYTDDANGGISSVMFAYMGKHAR